MNSKRIFSPFIFIGFAIGALGLFTTLPAVVKADEGEVQEFDVKKLGPENEQCNDLDSCPGMCSCTLEISPGNLIKVYKWTAYVEHNDRLFRLSGTAGSLKTAYYVEGTFKFDHDECRIPLDTNSEEQAKLRVKASCNYQPAFCCCVTDPKTGLLSDCKRNVYHTNPASTEPDFSPTCAQFSDGKHRPFLRFKNKELNNGQCQRFQDEFNNVITTEKEAKAQAQKGRDVKFESRTLNVLNINSPEELVGRVIQILMGFIGSIVFGLYVYAGVEWMTARGESEKIEKSKKIMFWATAGAAAMMASYVIVSNLFKLIKP